MPQQPESRLSRSTPIFSSTVSSSSILIEGFLMAMAMQHGFTRELRITEMRCFFQKKLAKKIGLAA